MIFWKGGEERGHDHQEKGGGWKEEEEGEREENKNKDKNKQKWGQRGGGGEGWGGERREKVSLCVILNQNGDVYGDIYGGVCCHWDGNVCNGCNDGYGDEKKNGGDPILPLFSFSLLRERGSGNRKEREGERAGEREEGRGEGKGGDGGRDGGWHDLQNGILI